MSTPGVGSLSGFVCLVTGATRGIGKGIALSLGKCGATVYITGRTLKHIGSGIGSGIGGSLEQTAEEIKNFGGVGIPVVVDHSEENQVAELFKRIDSEQNGRLDILVNNAYSAVEFLLRNGGKSSYKIDETTPGQAWDIVNNVGLRNVYICSVYAIRMMLAYQRRTECSKPGLIVNISSFGGKSFLFNAIYGIGKAALDRMAADMAHELKRDKAKICMISLWPGLVRTEHMQSARDKEIINWDLTTAESPELSGAAIAYLALEPTDRLMERSGQVVFVYDVAKQYDLRESDGSKPFDPHLAMSSLQ